MKLYNENGARAFQKSLMLHDGLNLDSKLHRARILLMLAYASVYNIKPSKSGPFRDVPKRRADFIRCVCIFAARELMYPDSEGNALIDELPHFDKELIMPILSAPLYAYVAATTPADLKESGDEEYVLELCKRLLYKVHLNRGLENVHMSACQFLSPAFAYLDKQCEPDSGIERPLSVQQIISLTVPFIAYGEDVGDDMKCPICLQPLDESPVMMHDRMHFFHAQCIGVWLGGKGPEKRACPICRVPALTHPFASGYFAGISTIRNLFDFMLHVYTISIETERSDKSLRDGVPNEGEQEWFVNETAYLAQQKREERLWRRGVSDWFIRDYGVKLTEALLNTPVDRVLDKIQSGML